MSDKLQWKASKLTPSQVECLKAALASYGTQPSSDIYTELAINLSLSRGQIRQWFKGQRRRSNNKDSVEGVGRQKLTLAQFKVLEEQLKRNPYPSTREYDQLACELGFPKKRLYAWFSCNRGPRKATVYKSPRYFTTQQREMLNRHFEVQPYPNHDEYVALAQQVGLSVLKVKDWFKRTRSQRPPTATNPSVNPIHSESVDKSHKSSYLYDDSGLELTNSDAWDDSDLSSYGLFDDLYQADLLKQTNNEPFASLDLVKPPELEVRPVLNQPHTTFWGSTVCQKPQVPMMPHGWNSVTNPLRFPVMTIRVETKSTMSVRSSGDSSSMHRHHTFDSFMRGSQAQHQRAIDQISQSLHANNYLPAYSIKLDHQQVTQSTIQQHYR